MLDNTSPGPTTYGLGDTEIGMKYRFIHETDTTPQVGTFPIMHIPTATATAVWVAATCRYSFRSGFKRAGANIPGLRSSVLMQ